MTEIYDFSITNYELVCMLGIFVVVCIMVFVYGEYFKTENDKRIINVMNLLDNKTESEKERIMTKFIVGLACARTTERRIYKIIAEGKDNVQTENTN